MVPLRLALFLSMLFAFNAGAAQPNFETSTNGNNDNATTVNNETTTINGTIEIGNGNGTEAGVGNGNGSEAGTGDDGTLNGTLVKMIDEGGRATDKKFYLVPQQDETTAAAAGATVSTTTSGANGNLDMDGMVIRLVGMMVGFIMGAPLAFA